jgi:hypothetical protein
MAQMPAKDHFVRMPRIALAPSLLEGHYLIIVKALYGLRMSGLRWHERFTNCLCNEGFSPCKAEPDIWMRLNGNLYEYDATYVDDLCLGMLDPKSFTDTL